MTKAEQNRQRENERYERAQRVWERRMERWNAWKREQREKAAASTDSQTADKQTTEK
jgi:hypothetical protein